MPYTPPARDVLRAAISRDLHDSDNKVFATDEVNDLINMGIAELNRLAPVEYLDDIALVSDTFTYELDANVEEVVRVEVWRDDKYARSISSISEQSNTGWEFFAHTLMLPTYLMLDPDEDSLKVWGYQVRDPLDDDDDVLDSDLDGENVIRSYCQFTCFQRLIASRALFQQWQTQANNADVSATQLLGMASVYAREWRDLRNRVRRLRRIG